jgi:hypothetical protein
MSDDSFPSERAIPLPGVGRPAKPDSNKRQQLQFSLYAEDIDRLEQLTDNRSEFIRQCIAIAWSEKQNGEKIITLHVPQSLIQELLGLLKQQLAPNRAALLQALIDDLFRE